ncbi:hypothetical protein H6G20_09855 [Desertifilum sp. FACHB-1129]|nr:MULTISPECIES: hypothetical protein [Desertifilum]MBD2311962.1 hypothetical protein [Desertifilum sp. FACHB-1129]MBD2322414.1 hypothetical protein [Desertifilum sp. FACHB-866]MBD2332577.1 hypothetical protein [Desertifilum sp. FACHB-868]MDA0211732.1 hypothetical protein [Cyanobacteria bacterium FC1]
MLRDAPEAASGWLRSSSGLISLGSAIALDCGFLQKVPQLLPDSRFEGVPEQPLGSRSRSPLHPPRSVARKSLDKFTQTIGAIWQ